VTDAIVSHIFPSDLENNTLGLCVVYAINTTLAVSALFQAGERGQPAFLWIAKTLSVGGLAYDQLTQLPTLEEVEQTRAKKGKRAHNGKANRKYS
jgi:hypothetical protein